VASRSELQVFVAAALIRGRSPGRTSSRGSASAEHPLACSRFPRHGPAL